MKILLINNVIIAFYVLWFFSIQKYSAELVIEERKFDDNSNQDILVDDSLIMCHSTQKSELCEVLDSKLEIRDSEEVKTRNLEESTELILLRHFIRNITLLFKENETKSEDLLLHLSPRAKEILIQWLDDNNDTYNSIDLFDAIKDSFYNIDESFRSKKSSFTDFSYQIEKLKELLTISCLLVLLTYFITQMEFDLKSLMFRIMILLFVISIPWNWLLLYKKAIATKQAQLSNSNAISEDCQNQKFTIGTWLQSLFSLESSNACYKHYESILVDPLWEISPTQALSETIIRFFVQPAEKLGAALSLSIRSLLENLPIQMWPIALIFLFLTIFFLLFATFRYSCYFPLFGGFEPAGDRRMIKLEERLQLLESNNKLYYKEVLNLRQVLALNGNNGNNQCSNPDCEECKENQNHETKTLDSTKTLTVRNE